MLPWKSNTQGKIWVDCRPVRDTACVAAGNFVKAYPEESKPQLDTLFGLFLANLKDPISSVRQVSSLDSQDWSEDILKNVEAANIVDPIL